MADEPKAGTPEGAVADGAQSPGTTPAPTDGGLMAGLTDNQRALFLAQEQKAAEGNKALSRVQELEARLAAIQQQQYVQQQAHNPLAEMVGELQQQAQYDVNAKGTLFALSAQAANAAENWLTGEMVKAKVPAEKWDTVAALVRQGNYQRPVKDALALASGSDVPDLQRQLEAERQKNVALEKALNERTVGSNGSRGNPATTTPAAASVEGVLEVTPEQYGQLSRADRERARIVQR